MKYDELLRHAEDLSYRDKLRLAQLLIQLGRKEEEEQNPEKREKDAPGSLDPELISYVAERLRKLRPSKKAALHNSIGAMFQFRGGISDEDKERIVTLLVKDGHIAMSENGRVAYPE